MRYVVDTNIWIEVMRKHKQACRRLEDSIRNGDDVVVIPVVYFELLRGLEKRGDTESIGFIRSLWGTLPYAECTRPVWDEAIRLWVVGVKANQKREDADVLIAAFASCLGATIVTDNLGHFTSLGLPLENWLR
jgi:predicted nucleic acid-binding protein